MAACWACSMQDAVRHELKHVASSQARPSMLETSIGANGGGVDGRGVLLSGGSVRSVSSSTAFTFTTATASP